MAAIKNINSIQLILHFRFTVFSFFFNSPITLIYLETRHVTPLFNSVILYTVQRASYIQFKFINRRHDTMFLYRPIYITLNIFFWAIVSPF